MLQVGVHDPLHELVAHHVGVGEPDERDVRHPLQHPHHVHETGALLARQVDLRDVAGDDNA